MNSTEGKPLLLGRVIGFRGNHGEVTVRVISGDAARWAHVSRVLIGEDRLDAEDGSRQVESARAYRDRLVLKLAGVGTPNEAAALRGRDVLVAAEDVPRLPRGTYWVERLVGARVKDGTMGDIGRVTDVIETGGSDLLVVTDTEGVETLVPMVREFVTEIDEASGTIVLAMPEGLLGLNASGKEPE